MQQANDDGSETRVLSNARCLSEGVDLPALDAICFFNKKSGTANRAKITLIQAVGRVMRKTKGKEVGYVLVPVILEKMTQQETIYENDYRLTDSSYRNLIDVINSLTAHDKNMRDALTKYKTSRNEQHLLGLIDVRPSRLLHKESTGVVEDAKQTAIAQKLWSDDDQKLQTRIFACIARAQGRVKDWTDYEPDIRQFANKMINTVNRVLQQHITTRLQVTQFTKDLQATINGHVTEKEATEMIVKHYLTLPVFNIIFRDDALTQHNPIARVLQKQVALFDQEFAKLREQDTSWDAFLEWLRLKSERCRTWREKDAYLKNFYQKFFHIFDKNTAESLGIVYTPDELVDFMLAQTNRLLENYWGLSLNNPRVKILDLFSGTGTFLSRLLGSSKLIKTENALQAFNTRFFAQEKLSLAYYITSLNLQAVLKEKLNLQSTPTVPFQNIALGDSFIISDQNQTQMQLPGFQENENRKQVRRHRNINVIIGNPPYFCAQSNPNKISPRTSYAQLYQKWKAIIAVTDQTYNLNSLYNYAYLALYVAYDILKKQKQGMVAYLMPNGFLASRSGGGLRKWLSTTFRHIFVLDLHGDIQSGIFIKSKREREGGNVFGSGSQTGIQIIFLVYDEQKPVNAITPVSYLSVNQLLPATSNRTTQQKLAIVKSHQWQDIWAKSQKITLNQQLRWLDQSDHLLIANDNFFYPLMPSKTQTHSFFNLQTNGVVTSRDPWCINFSAARARNNMTKTISFYNTQVNRQHQYRNLAQFQQQANRNPQNIKWGAKLWKRSFRGESGNLEQDGAIKSIYHRPFCLTNIYYSAIWCERLYKTEECFSINYPDRKAVIGIVIPTQSHSPEQLDVLAVQDHLIGLQFIEAGKFYPLYTFRQSKNLITQKKVCHINSWAQTQFGTFYPQWVQNKTDLPEKMIAYLYGLLHSPSYIKQFSQHLRYEPPRVCFVKNQSLAQKIFEIGQQLMQLHLNWQELDIKQCWVKGCCAQIRIVKKPTDESEPFSYYQLPREGMRFAKVKSPVTGRPEADQTEIIYNQNIKLQNIPRTAYWWKINGRSVVEQFINFYRYNKKAQKLGITNDPNEFLNERGQTYLLDNLKRLIYIAVQTKNLVDQIPTINFQDKSQLYKIS